MMKLADRQREMKMRLLTEEEEQYHSELAAEGKVVVSSENSEIYTLFVTALWTSQSDTKDCQ